MFFIAPASNQLLAWKANWFPGRGASICADLVFEFPALRELLCIPARWTIHDPASVDHNRRLPIVPLSTMRTCEIAIRQPRLSLWLRPRGGRPRPPPRTAIQLRRDLGATRIRISATSRIASMIRGQVHIRAPRRRRAVSFSPTIPDAHVDFAVGQHAAETWPDP
jgi:hypothetical protein